MQLSFEGKEQFKELYMQYLRETYSKDVSDCSDFELYENLVHIINDAAATVRAKTSKRHAENQEKKIYYFSMEFLIGKLLDNYLINTGNRDLVEEALADMGISLEKLEAIEPDPGLGNGGLGRLAACFLDSMAAHGVPGVGMGIRYRFGLFKQKIVDGYQTELPDAWLADGYPWEIAKPADSVEVQIGGYVDRRWENGKMYFEHKGYTSIKATPYDVMVVGYAGNDVNVLRLWHASPMHETIDMAAFNSGDYSKALEANNQIEAINCILYPDDSMGAGRRLRLTQEYFFVAAGIASIIKQYKKTYGNNVWDKFADRVSIHTNDTHPALCVPELMRVLIDEENLEWNDAWAITRKTISFTNHTVLPEALEKWSIELFRNVLPRVYMIIEEIDRRWREYLRRTGNDSADVAKNTAILWDGEAKMANLSIIGSHSVNGVAALHSQILIDYVFNDYYKLDPSKFNNKTNGVSHRRFMIQSNPELAKLVTEAIGDGWKSDMSKIEELLKFKDDAAFLEKMSQIKRANKVTLSNYIINNNGISVNPDSIFDIQVKRIHAYKRQLLNAFKVLDLYNKLNENPNLDMEPVTFVFAGKAAQGYAFAKEVIKFINSVASLVNSDPVISQKIKVVFIENFCVSNAQLIYPAADISEQISTAGKEASGTGNMKFMMNGAFTLGTLDGANIEIKNVVGDDNIKIFGLTADQTEKYYKIGGYNAKACADNNPALSLIINQLVDGTFERFGMNFWGIFDDLMQHNDPFFVLADFDSYVNAWKEVTNLHKDSFTWNQKSLINIAKSGFFSSDRTIEEYATKIWHTRYDK
ncbi:MAG: glycogen/starch/alpha-glucan phosphorylase [Clostridia bacterium]|nr:glycogen/starch/alpha-glucan phosphorylase [Clostridia bacterium]